MNLANEGLEARKKEEEVETRKRKAEDDKAWEGIVHSLTHSYLSSLMRLQITGRRA
jgi:DnaJ homolog subfamily C member 8